MTDRQLETMRDKQDNYYYKDLGQMETNFLETV